MASPFLALFSKEVSKMFGQCETVADWFNELSTTVQMAFATCRMIYTDFDGVWTDGNLVLHGARTGLEEFEAVPRSRADSLGVNLLSEAGLYNEKNYDTTDHEVDIAILSREPHPVLTCVAKKIKVKVQGALVKKDRAMMMDMSARDLRKSEVIWMGNDLNDLVCVPLVGLFVAVADSHPLVLRKAGYVTRSLGGRGAVREVIEFVLYAKGKHPYLSQETGHGE